MVQKKTKRQHYVQREYLKNFCIKDSEYIYSYNLSNGKIGLLKPSSLCIIKNMYERSGSLDNKIESHIKEYEDKGIVQIKKIIQNGFMNAELFSKEDLKNLYHYVFLQLMRTKSGQLIFQSIKEGLNNGFTDCRKHVSNYELNLNKEIISNNTQWIYDNLEEFDQVIDSLWRFCQFINVCIYVSEQPLLITTDNPVYTDVVPSLKMPYLCYLKIALSPNILLDIELVMQDRLDKKINLSKFELSKEDAENFNKNIISNANYWIMSSIEFSREQKTLIFEQHKK